MLMVGHSLMSIQQCLLGFWNIWKQIVYSKTLYMSGKLCSEMCSSKAEEISSRVLDVTFRNCLYHSFCNVEHQKLLFSFSNIFYQHMV
jgi:hypothetical protein